MTERRTETYKITDTLLGQWETLAKGIDLSNPDAEARSATLNRAYSRAKNSGRDLIDVLADIEMSERKGRLNQDPNSFLMSIGKDGKEYPTLGELTEANARFKRERFAKDNPPLKL